MKNFNRLNKRAYLTSLVLTLLALGSGLLLHSGQSKAMPGGSCSDTAITFTGAVTMDFNTIEGTAGTGSIDMGTNANITYGAGYSGGGSGVAGVFVVNGTKGCKVSIECDATATISDGSGNTVTIDSIEVSSASNKNFGSGTACAGIGTKVLTGQGINNEQKATFYLGGSIDGTSGIPSDGSYAASNSGGNQITIEVTYDNP